MAKKQDYATKSDIKRLEKAIKKNREDILAFKRDTDKRFQTHEEKIEIMITGFKDEILNHLDEIMKELTTSREEQIIIGHQTTEHEEKPEDHEKRIIHLEAPLIDK